MPTLRALGLASVASAALTILALLTAPTAGLALTLAQARLVALKHVAGPISREALTRRGRSWRYLFEIRQRHVVRKIAVDPANGKVVEDVAVMRAAADQQGTPQ